jgi:hypothetical protein
MLIIDTYPNSSTISIRTSIRGVIKVSKTFSNLLKHSDKLPHTKKRTSLSMGKRYVEPASSVGGRLINDMRETRFKEGFECPHCASEHVVRFGKYNGGQRYRCKCCKKTFTDTTMCCSRILPMGKNFFLLKKSSTC